MGWVWCRSEGGGLFSEECREAGPVVWRDGGGGGQERGPRTAKCLSASLTAWIHSTLQYKAQKSVCVCEKVLEGRLVNAVTIKGAPSLYMPQTTSVAFKPVKIQTFRWSPLKFLHPSASCLNFFAVNLCLCSSNAWLLTCKIHWNTVWK